MEQESTKQYSMPNFETLLQEHFPVLKRFVHYKVNHFSDAEDIIQEVCLTATEKSAALKQAESFKPWLLGIATNKCKDYYRRQAKVLELPYDALSETALGVGRLGVTEQSVVQDTLERLGDKEKQMLYLYFFKNLQQEEIAKKLSLPLGTVKSRLHYAKEKFKARYPYPPKEKEEKVRRTGMNVKQLSDYMPEYSIEKIDKKPFSVKWEELMGWFLVPKLGESLFWGMYDMPSRKLDYRYDMKVTGRAMVHGIEGVEIEVEETDGNGNKGGNIERTFVAQLTDTHCRYLAALREQDGLKQYITFLDGDAFMPNWGFGEDNCGNETNLSPKGDITRNGNEVISVNKDFLLDIVGRYNVTINGKTYDTVCVMDIETYNTGVVSEQFLDKNGRTILWRRFNRNDWAQERYGKPWTELLPDNDRLVINGQIYVQWYDCITDYIL